MIKADNASEVTTVWCYRYSIIIIIIIKARLLGVTVASDLSLDGHIFGVCNTYFFWFRQLKRVLRSLDTESTTTLVDAFVTSRVDYCNSVMPSASKKITDQLQRVLSAAARLICITGNYKRGLSQLLHDDLL